MTWFSFWQTDQWARAACPLVNSSKTSTPFTRSSKHQANIEQMYSKYTCYCSTSARRLLLYVSWTIQLDVCSTSARCLLDVCSIV